MEYYRLYIKNKIKYLIIFNRQSFNLYDKNMKLEKTYKDNWNLIQREQLISKATLVTDENELAKLMLICNI